MANIRKTVNSDGTNSYHVCIRRKGISVSQSFTTIEDAKLYTFYKERLIDNMNAFDVPLKERITLEALFELKINSVDIDDHRMIGALKVSLERLKQTLPKNMFYQKITYEDWLAAAHSLSEMKIFKGANKEHNLRKISISSLRNIFAYASTSVSYANSLGIPLENYPLKVIQAYIAPLMKQKK